MCEPATLRANEMAVHVTRNIPTLSEKKVICRLHSYEAFADYPKQIEWNLITALIFVADHLKDITLELVPEVKKTSIHVIPNGINLDHWKFAKRKPGYEIAYVGAINYKKGSILLPHLFKAVYDQDPKYRFHLAGEFKDARYALYFKQMLYELGIKNNFRIYNKVDDVNAWLEDKNYIVSTSLLESQQLSLCEAMAKGIKPVIHNFVGARSLYPGEYIFNTMDEAVEMICSEEYDSEKYRGFVSERYNMKNQLQKIDALLQNITNCKQNESNYN
jgi:glycosyltransferase involved in cell wall biosynthesis